MRDVIRDLFSGRPGWMNALLLFCAYMTVVYVPWDLFLKPVSRDVEVWFGVAFHGWAAKLLAIPHWAVYAAGTVGFWGMRRWMWPWAALYCGQVAFGMVLWPLLHLGGLRGLLAAAVSGGFFGVLTVALWRARPLFQPPRVRLRERFGEWALVTGASSGIGREFARALAAEGHALVLCARRAERLQELARELEARHGTATRVVALDLGETGGAERLLDAVRGLEVGVLVNNAGFGAIGRFDAMEPGRVRAMTELQCTAPAVLARGLLPGMRARGRGAIVMVGSVAGVVPLPLHALYSASKAFDNLLGEALHGELRGSGVAVLALEPGPVQTEFQQQAGEVAHAGASAARVVAEALDALGRQPALVPGWRDWLRVNAAARLLPRSLLLVAVRHAMLSRTPPEKR